MIRKEEQPVIPSEDAVVQLMEANDIDRESAYQIAVERMRKEIRETRKWRRRYLFQDIILILATLLTLTDLLLILLQG